jgi:protein SCO1
MNDTTQHRIPPYLVTVALIAFLLASALLFTRLASAYTDANGGSAATSSHPTKFQGATIDNVTAPTFTLKDQTGATVSLAQLKGKPVVLTFFDSHCPHAECPLMAQSLKIAARNLGTRTSQVEWVAVSVNPTDTPASASTFLSGNGITFPIHYMLGTQDQLAPVWAAYHIVSTTGSDGIVIHSTGVYLIDQQGRERIFLGDGFDPQMLSSDVTLLLST